MYINKSIENLLSFWLIIMFVLVSSIIVVGGLTRLTDSGLSITEWELFKGFLPPFSNTEWVAYFNLYKEIPEYKLQNFNMSLDEFKVIFWWEWAHRFLGRIIGLFFLIPLIYFIFRLGFKKTKPYILIFILICAQGFPADIIMSDSFDLTLSIAFHILEFLPFLAAVNGESVSSILSSVSKIL